MPTPQDVTWYIEVRPWIALPGQPPGFAPADPAQMGSAVAIALETLDAQGQPYNPRQIRKYLLTCAHVVRDGQTGPLHEEIFCWPHTRGYTRAEENTRLSGSFPGVSRAMASPCSPCAAVRGAVAHDAAHGAPDYLDWMLLNVVDPAFQAVNVITTWAEASLGAGYSITGYPGGAGKLADQGRAQFLANGDKVKCIHSTPFQVDEPPSFGTFRVTGAGRTAPGMSGGGAFDNNGALVGLHRASVLSALNCIEIEFNTIVDWLKTHRSMVPVATKQVASVRPLSRQDPKQIEAPVLGQHPMIPVFNRAKLRANLRDLITTGNQYRMLCLEGDPGTGKSYSWHLIHHVAKEFGIRVAYLDVIGGVSLEEAMSSIVTQLGLNYDDFERFVLNDSPTPDRMGGRMARWLSKATESGGDRYWIVFDSLSPLNQPPQYLMDQLIRPLTNAISGNTALPYVTLLHLGGEKPTRIDLAHFVLDERVEAIERANIENFVADYAASIGKSLSADAMQNVVDAIVEQHVPPYRGSVLDKIARQAVDVVKAVIV